MKGLTDIPGIRVGQVSDYKSLTGCTVILCEGGAVAGVDVRGSATGTEEFDVLNPMHVTDRIHGLVFAGGSAFGLETASGVRRYLERKGVGFKFGNHVIPIVPAAILFDLGLGEQQRHPSREMGEAAAAAATDAAVEEGSVGAGTGATVGKLRGMKHAMKGGMGSYTVTLPGGVMVSALVAVNALGDVRDPANRAIVAGARVTAEGREFADSEKLMLSGSAAVGGPSNTTLAVVATNAKLTKLGATKLAQFAGLGMARTISPVNTSVDGDLVVALSVGGLVAQGDALGLAAANALSEAILRAVRKARSLGGVPGLLQVQGL